MIFPEQQLSKERRSEKTRETVNWTKQSHLCGQTKILSRTFPVNPNLIPDADEDTIPEYALAEWYDYDISTHTLTPKEAFYIIHNRNNLYFKFRILDYYDAAGTPAMLSIEWEEILPPTQ